MNKKTATTNSLTKKDLIDVLKPYATKMDLKQLEGKFDKHEISSQKRYIAMQKLIDLKMNLRFEAEEEKTNKLITKFKNIILTAIDPLLQELETRRQDREIASDQMLKVKDDLENHEKRIKKLEQS